jgi:hypothetical protein
MSTAARDERVSEGGLATCAHGSMRRGAPPVCPKGSLPDGDVPTRRPTGPPPRTPPRPAAQPPGLHVEAEERQCVRGGIGHRPVRVLREGLVAAEHDAGLLTDHHAGGGLAGEVGVEGEAERREERLTALEVRNGDGDEQVAGGVGRCGHGGSPGRCGDWYDRMDRAGPRNSSVGRRRRPGNPCRGPVRSAPRGVIQQVGWMTSKSTSGWSGCARRGGPSLPAGGWQP